MTDRKSGRYLAFLSHNTEDKPAVEELARRLEADGIACFLDKWHLIPGKAWQPALEDALDRSDTCVVFVGPSGLGPWQNEEMRAAIARRVAERNESFGVIPCVLPGGHRDQRSHLPTFLTAATWVEFHETLNEEDAYHRLKCGIRGIPPGPSPGAAFFEGQCPYRGLQYFDTDDSRFFFGRDSEVDWMLDRLGSEFGTPQETRFLGVVGASGSGKSSLVRAGLVPAIQAGRSRNGKSLPGSADWPVLILKPGVEPLKALADALWSEPSVRPVVVDSLGFADLLLVDPRRLHGAVGTALATSGMQRRFVIVIDQFEELFTQCPAEGEDQRKAFIDNLLYAATVTGGRTLVIITMRADFYGRCAKYERLAHALMDGQELVPPLGDPQLREAIQRPAQLCGWELESGLVDLLLQGMRGQPAGALPLLQQTLFMLWERRDGRRLTVKSYRDIGEIDGALESHANHVYQDELKTDDQRDICRRVLLMLTTPGEGTEDTRRRVPRKYLGVGASVEVVLDTLVRARLVTVSETTPPQIEVTHEALIRGWHALRSWIDSDRDSLRVLQRLVTAAESWEAGGRSNEDLYRDSRLIHAEAWCEQHSSELEHLAIVREFVATAISLRDTEKDRRRAEERQRIELLQQTADAAQQAAATERSRQRLLLGASIVISFVCVLAAFSSYVAWSRNGHLAQVRSELEEEKVKLTLSEATLTTANGKLEVAIGVAKANEKEALQKIAEVNWLQAFQYRKEHQSALAGLYFLSAIEHLRKSGEFGRIRSSLLAVKGLEEMPLRSFPGDSSGGGAIFTKDGRKVLSFGWDAVRLWDLATDTLIHEWQQENGLFGAVFSSDETRVMTWGPMGVELLDVNKDKPIRQWKQEGGVRIATFNGDETQVLSWGGRVVQLWDVMTDTAIRRWEPDEGISGAVFNRNDTQVVIWGGRAARLWDLTMDTPLRQWMSEREMSDVILNKNGTQVLSWDGYTAQLWDVTTDTQIRRWKPEEGVSRAVFNPGGSHVLMWSGRIVHLWDVTTDEPIRQWKVAGGVYEATFNKDGTCVLFWGQDGVYLCDVGADTFIRRWMQEGGALGAIFSRDEKQVVSWGRSGAYHWDVMKDAPIRQWKTEEGVSGSVFNGDDTQVLTWGDEGARLWDVTSNTAVRHWRQHGGVSKALFDKNAARVLMYGESGARLWNVKTEAPVRQWTQEEEVYEAKFDQGETQVLTRSDEGVGLWGMTTDSAIRQWRREEGVSEAIFSRDGSRVLTWGDQGAGLWNPNDQAADREWKQEGGVSGAVFDRDETKVLTWGGSGVGLWDLTKDTPIRQWKREEGVSKAIFSRDGSRILTWGDQGAGLWNLNNQTAVREWKQEGGVSGAVFDRDETKVLTWGRSGAGLWGLTTNMAIRRWEQREGVSKAILNRDETRVLTWGRSGVGLWDVAADAPIRQWNISEGVGGAVLSPDGLRVVTWGWSGAQLWDVETGAKVRDWIQEGGVTGALFDRHSRWVLTWGRRGSGLWSVASNTSVRQWSEQGRVLGAIFNRDETQVLTWGHQSVGLWDVTTDAPIRQWRQKQGISGAVFDRSETRILTWGGDGTRLWDISLDASVSIEEQIVEHEVRTAMALDSSGRPKNLEFKEWDIKRKQLADLRQQRAKSK